MTEKQKKEVDFLLAQIEQNGLEPITKEDETRLDRMSLEELAEELVRDDFGIIKECMEKYPEDYVLFFPEGLED